MSLRDIRYMSKAELDELNRQRALWRQSQHSQSDAPDAGGGGENDAEKRSLEEAQAPQQLDLFEPRTEPYP